MAKPKPNEITVVKLSKKVNLMDDKSVEIYEPWLEDVRLLVTNAFIVVTYAAGTRSDNAEVVLTNGTTDVSVTQEITVDANGVIPLTVNDPSVLIVNGGGLQLEFDQESVGAVTATIARADNVATITTGSAHGLSAGQVVDIIGLPTAFNGRYEILTVPSTTSFTYYNVGPDVQPTANTAGLVGSHEAEVVVLGVIQ